MPDEHLPPDPTPEEIQAAFDQVTERIENHLWVQYAVALARVVNRGDRISLGMPTVDANLGGGPYPGSILVIQGRPHSGKTLLATQFGLHAARTCSVGALYHDEGLPGAVIRIGQQLGGEKEALEKGDKGEVAKVFARMAELDFHLFKPDEPESTLEAFIEQMHDRATKGKREVWLLDSAQTLRSKEFHPRMTATERITATINIVRSYATRFNALAIMTAKMSRAGYRSKRDDENIEPIAASRDASDIEYGCEAILSIHGNPEENAELRCPKNRYGTVKATFKLPLKLDFGQARYYEVDQKEVEYQEEQKRVAHESEVVKAAAERMYEIVKLNPDLTTRQLWQAMGKMRQQTKFDARELLQKENRLFFDGRKGGDLRWYVGEK